MKIFIKIFFSIILLIVLLGVIFYMVDTTRVNNDEEPIFTFNQKLIDGIDYSAKVDVGLGYKIIRYDILNKNEVIKSGTIFMDEEVPYIEKEEIKDIVIVTSGDSGEKIVKITTFGEKYEDLVYIEGLEENVYVQVINSKLGYNMKYYFELFEYAGFEDYDRYLWHLSSGDFKSTMTVYDISNEEAHKETIEKLDDKELFEQLSGEQAGNIQKCYFRASEDNEIEKVNYIYIVDLNDMKLMVDLYYPREAEEGVGVYMRKMLTTINAEKTTGN